MEKESDYNKALNIIRDLPKYCIGQEINTEFGKGIITYIDMPCNGLYLQPEKTIIHVWYGTQKAWEDDIKWVKKEFKLYELNKYNKLEL